MDFIFKVYSLGTCLMGRMNGGSGIGGRSLPVLTPIQDRQETKSRQHKTGSKNNKTGYNDKQIK